AARAAEPDQPAYQLALAALASRQHQPDAAVKILADAEKQFGDRVDIRLARGRLAASRPDASAALAKLAKGTDKFSAPDEVELLAGLYRICRTVDLKLARDLGGRLTKLVPLRVDLH